MTFTAFQRLRNRFSGHERSGGSRFSVFKPQKNRCSLSEAPSSRAICVPVRGHLLDGLAGRYGFRGLLRLSCSRSSSPRLFTVARTNCTLLRFSPYGRRPRPRNQFPGFHSLMHFLALPLQESHRCSRVLTCRELLPVVFHKQSIWPLQPCRSSLNKTNSKRL